MVEEAALEESRFSPVSLEFFNSQTKSFQMSSWSVRGRHTGHGIKFVPLSNASVRLQRSCGSSTTTGHYRRNKVSRECCLIKNMKEWDLISDISVWLPASGLCNLVPSISLSVPRTNSYPESIYLGVKPENIRLARSGPEKNPIILFSSCVYKTDHGDSPVLSIIISHSVCLYQFK